MEEPQPFTIDVFDSVTTVLEAVKLRKFEDGFMVGETISRDKIADKSKLRAHEILTIDRSDPARTVKYHRVQEYDARGNPAGEPHEHTEIFQAKRRPRT